MEKNDVVIDNFNTLNSSGVSRRKKMILGRDIVSDAINPDHFLKKVFKKKPGGTVIGNLIRLGANKATGGILGTGKNRLPVATTPTIDSSKADALRREMIAKTQASLNQSMSGLPAGVGNILTDAGMLPKTQILRDAERAAVQNEEGRGVISMGGMSFNPLYIVAAVAVIIAVVLIAKR